jgi:triosephosphate isomerase
MSRQKIVAGNWKMNLGLTEATELVKNVVQQANKNPEVRKIFFPPMPFLKPVVDLVIDDQSFSVGGQNCSEHVSGAYTGETSAAMIKSAGGAYVIIGHSERRQYFKESSKQLAAKISRALENDLNVIFCFGELLADRKSQNHFTIVKQQLQEVLSEFPKEKVSKLILAYEPVWAIGTGETASPAQAQEMHQFIRKTIADIFSKTVADEISILYGGSCNAQNAKELFACPDVDGGLIGGASLKAPDFCTIIKSF